MRRNGFKLTEGGFRPNIRKKSLSLRVVRCWNGLSREAVAALYLQVLKASWMGFKQFEQLTVVEGVSTQGMCGGWEQRIFEVPPNPNYSLIPLTLHLEAAR